MEMKRIQGFQCDAFEWGELQFVSMALQLSR